MGTRVYLELPKEKLEPFWWQDRDRRHLRDIEVRSGSEPLLWYLVLASPEAERVTGDSELKLQLTGRLVRERLATSRRIMIDLFSGSACDPKSNHFLGKRFPVGSPSWEQIRAIATNYPVRDVLELQDFLSQEYDDTRPVTLDLDQEMGDYEGKMPELWARLDERLNWGGRVYQALVDCQLAGLAAPMMARAELPADLEVLAWVLATTDPGWDRSWALSYYFPEGDEERGLNISW